MFIVSAKFDPKKSPAGRRPGSSSRRIVRSTTSGRLLPRAEPHCRHRSGADGLPGELGWEADPTPETLTFSLPQPLNAAYEEYNQCSWNRALT